MSASQEFSGRVVMVTGGGSGIGASTCRLLALQGAAVAVVDFDPAAAHQMADELRRLSTQALAIEADVADAKAMQGAVARTVDELGNLHLAVNNAGIPSPYAAVGDLDLDTWSRVLEVNLTGVFVSMRYQIPALLANGGGAIVNLSSDAGITGNAGAAIYCASKGGVVQLVGNSGDGAGHVANGLGGQG